MNEGLEQFEHEEKIGQYSRTLLPADQSSRRFPDQMDRELGWQPGKEPGAVSMPTDEHCSTKSSERKLSKTFDFNGNYPFTRMLRRQVNGENDSWAIRWNASLFLADMLSLNVGKSLIQNTG